MQCIQSIFNIYLIMKHFWNININVLSSVHIGTLTQSEILYQKNSALIGNSELFEDSKYRMMTVFTKEDSHLENRME